MRDVKTPSFGTKMIAKMRVTKSKEISAIGVHSGLVMNFLESKVSVDLAKSWCVFSKPLGVRTKVEPLNVVPMNTILPFILDQSLSV